MPRYKEYNEKRVLDLAMQQFWGNGYYATSLSTLTEVMNINKFTFYDVFESKEKLLIRTMSHYYNLYHSPCRDQLQTGYDITTYFLGLFEQRKDNLCGCYILSITSEIGDSIPDAVKILDEYIKTLEKISAEIVMHKNPDTPEKTLSLKVNQFMALLTAVPMMNSINSEEECINYTNKMLSLIRTNN